MIEPFLYSRKEILKDKLARVVDQFYNGEDSKLNACLLVDLFLKRFLFLLLFRNFTFRI